MYMYKEDLALNNLQWLIYHKIKPSLNKDAQVLTHYEIHNTEFAYKGHWITALKYLTADAGGIECLLHQLSFDCSFQCNPFKLNSTVQ